MSVRLLRRIVQVMSDSTLICNPDFSLERLAHIVDSNRTYVSLVINNTYNKNFKSLLNEYRIREACKRLSDNRRSDTCCYFRVSDLGRVNSRAEA